MERPNARDGPSEAAGNDKGVATITYPARPFRWRDRKAPERSDPAAARPQGSPERAHPIGTSCCVCVYQRLTSAHAGLRAHVPYASSPFWNSGDCGRGLPPSHPGRTQNSLSAQ